MASGITRVVETMVIDHDPRLLVLAVGVCAFGAVSTLNISRRALSSRRHWVWLGLVTLCAGATVWATHFIAMLAYLQHVATRYDPMLTLLSFVSGLVIMGFGFWLAIRADAGWSRPLGGAVTGAGVIVLHYVGMAALHLPGGIEFDPMLVGASMLFSIGFGVPSLTIAYGFDRPRARAIGAAFMFAMIISLHFTAMGAVNVDHGALAGGGVADGMTRPVLALAVAIASMTVLLIGLGGALIEQKVAERLAAEAERFRTLADGAFEGLIVHRNGLIVDANAAARRLLGVGEHTAEFRSWYEIVVDGAALAGTDDPIEVELERVDGTRFPAEICRRRIRLGDGGEGELCAIRDLTQRKQAEAQIAHLALHDSLTDLPNRRYFMEFAHKALARAQRGQERFAVLAIDVDDFKNVNDTLGHAAGDELIRVIAHRIAAIVREADIGARVGGDEFAILTTGASRPGQAMVLAERLLESLQVPVQSDVGEIALTVSIGIAIYPDNGTSVEDLLRNADTAMYRAKTEGKSGIRFFEAGMDAELVARRTLERRLRRAVADHRLAVAYQPIVEAQGRAPLGFEALIRWHDEELGYVAPADFIPLAEETGLIVPIGAFVVRQACLEATKWPDHLRVAVNLSVVQFRRKGLVNTVRTALAESGLDGRRLELEVTETLLMDNREEVVRQLNELKTLGVRISMDDFGTGYSALGYLQCFPFDKIKIDRVFVTDLATNPQNAAIVRAVAAMGRSLRMRVVAEGVETDNEANMLMDLECDEIQGYLIARPMPASEVTEFLESNPGAPRPRLVHAIG